MAKTQTLTVRSSQELAQIDELEKLLISGEKVEQTIVSDPAQVSREIIAELLAAESDDDLFAGRNAIGWRELPGLPIELAGFNWRPSTLEEGSNIFFVVRGTRMDTGEKVVLTTGAGNVLAQLVNMAKRGTMVGAVVKLVEAKNPTRAGFRPLSLELVTPAAAA